MKWYITLGFAATTLLLTGTIIDFPVFDLPYEY